MATVMHSSILAGSMKMELFEKKHKGERLKNGGMFGRQVNDKRKHLKKLKRLNKQNSPERKTPGRFQVQISAMMV